MNALAPSVNIAGWSWTGVQGANLGPVWPLALGLLQPCLGLDGGRYDAAALRLAIETGDMQLWLFGPMVNERLLPALAMTTEIRVYPCQKWLNIRYIAGEGLLFAADFLGTIEAWGRVQGCIGVEAGGRPGWKRFLEKRGYIQNAVSVQRKFDA